MSPEQRTVAFVLLVLIVLATGFRYVRDNILVWSGAIDLTKPEEAPQIMVHVTGAVKAPGVYRFQKGSRVMDAVASAQGVTEDADTETINMAAILVDGQRVFVPAKPPETPAEASKPVESQPSTPPRDTRVNINTATQLALESLPGVGPQMAKRIIEHRQKNGRFESVEDLVKVSGIGERLLERLRPLVKVK